MGIRKKTFIFILSSFLILFLVLLGLMWILLTQSYAETEKKYTDQQVKQAVNFFNENINSLKKTSYDWAAWDESYGFMLGQNPDFIETQVAETFYQNIRVNLLLFVDNNGKLVYGRARDFDKGEDMEIDRSFLDDFQPKGSLEKQIQADQIVSGVLVKSGLPYIFAASPITKTNGDGPIDGTLIMARILSAKEIEMLAKVSRLPISIATVEKAQAQFKELGGKIPTGDVTYVNPANAQQVAGYALINDPYGNGALVLRVLNQRDIYNQGLRTILLILLIDAGCSILIVIAMILFFKKIILDKIKIINDFVRNISAGTISKDLIKITGSDELSILGEDINKMTTSLNSYNEERLNKDKKLEASEKQLRSTVEELERFNKFAINREIKMVELKRKIREMEEKLGEHKLSEN